MYEQAKAFATSQTSWFIFQGDSLLALSLLDGGLELLDLPSALAIGLALLLALLAVTQASALGGLGFHTPERTQHTHSRVNLYESPLLHRIPMATVNPSQTEQKRGTHFT